MHRLRVYILLTATILWMPVSVNALTLQRQTPQPFGFFIGDVIHHRIIADTDQHTRLSPASLPTPQALTYWLDLRDVQISSQSYGQYRRYIIDLEYQVFYSALTATRLEIPAFKLGFETDQDIEHLREQTLPAWPFIVSSLRGLETGVTGQQGTLRNDREPNQIETQKLQRRIFTLLFASLLLFLLLAHHRTLWPFRLRPSRPFASAAATLKHDLKRAASGSHSATPPLKVMHRAFDTTVGKRLFADDLPDFFEHHPIYCRLQEEIHTFYKTSREFYFSSESRTCATLDTKALTTLAKKLAELERREC